MIYSVSHPGGNPLLKSIPKEFNQQIADECGHKTDHKIGR